MSLARAFTTRRANKGSADLGDSVKRSHTLHRTPSQRALRNNISAPLELVHTTNMLAYNAPDIYPRQPSRTNSNATSSTIDESDAATSNTTTSTAPSSPGGENEYSPGPKPNHLSSYFVAPGTAVVHGIPADAPAIPKRSPSHTKKNSMDALARKQSLSRLSENSNPSLSFSRSSSTSTRVSATSHSSGPHQMSQAPPMPPQQYSAKADASPFGQELAQVTELAEDFSAGRLDVIYEDEQYIRTRGLAQMSADDYLNDVHEVMATFFPDSQQRVPVTPMWI